MCTRCTTIMIEQGEPGLPIVYEAFLSFFPLFSLPPPLGGDLLGMYAPVRLQLPPTRWSHRGDAQRRIRDRTQLARQWPSPLPLLPSTVNDTRVLWLGAFSEEKRERCERLDAPHLLFFFFFPLPSWTLQLKSVLRPTHDLIPVRTRRSAGAAWDHAHVRYTAFPGDIFSLFFPPFFILGCPRGYHRHGPEIIRWSVLLESVSEA